ncbi:nicotinate-nucleotide adenylyltransferase [Lysobacter solisilvae (ex Woo and Kim 2020)]|uniref:Probable nicotinate-nucleotide adenylyltransferase n=1 Tax=Agrilutibacter terrestris TaxID=2865112 RepID=A0A7H0G1P2_9GAMM|nr:nicotinate-nucleotide adenylyltransferase [Lysobacter terrestris]QNP42208.1 nicotinate-nucleotide adenylyltransferase [Lysobacter terrestris]
MAAMICYGGTFDPVHNGHLAVARAARDAMQARVRLLPAADPPHKGPTQADAQQRARMLDLATAGETGLKVDRRELHRAGPSYTIDTLLELRAQSGGLQPIIWLVGGDSLQQLHTWHRWRELFTQAHILAVQRPGAHIDPDMLGQVAPEVAAEAAARWRPLAELAHSPAGGLAVLPLQELRPESSTALRRRIAARDPGWRDWVPPSVASYIDRHRLYSTAAPDSGSL